MANETQQTITFEELFGIPQNTQNLEALDLQGIQQHLRHLLTYIEETRSLHVDDAASVDELVAALTAAQKTFRNAEVDHANETQEVADQATGEIHDILQKKENVLVFEALLSSYLTALQGLRRYVDNTILRLNAAGKLDLE